MSMAIDAANLGYAIKNSSDLIVVMSDVKTVLSNIVSFRSDIIATTDSDLVTILSNITSFRSDIVATTDSDIVVIQSNLTIVKSDLLLIPASGAAVTWNATALASINAEVDTALNTAVPVTPTANSINDILSKLDGANTFDNTTDSLEAIRDKIDTLPTSGAVVSTASATTTGVIVQDGTTGTPNVVLVAAAGSVNTFGSWTELDASTSAISWLCGISIGMNTTNEVAASVCVEIGTGGAGAEVAKIRHSFYYRYMSSAGIDTVCVFTFPIPIKVAASTRIAARMSSSYAAVTVDAYIGLSMYQSLET